MKRLLQYLNIFGFLGTVIVNALANILPINNLNTGELSDAIPNLFVPVGLTFSIWGVIYLLLAGYTIYQARDLFSKNQKDDPFFNRVGIWFFIGSLANIAWILLWHYQLVPWSLLAMLVLLASLILIYLRVNVQYLQKSTSSTNTKWDVLFYRVPFSVYLGWITIATVANVTAVLVVLNWTRFGFTEALWTDIVLVVATVITLGMVFLRKDLPYSLVVIWAFIGIILKRIDPVFPPHLDIVITAAVGIGFIILAYVLVLIRSVRHK